MEFQIILIKSMQTSFYLEAKSEKDAEAMAMVLVANQEHYDMEWSRDAKTATWDLEEVNLVKNKDSKTGILKDENFYINPFTNCVARGSEWNEYRDGLQIDKEEFEQLYEVFWNSRINGWDRLE